MKWRGVNSLWRCPTTWTDLAKYHTGSGSWTRRASTLNSDCHISASRQQHDPFSIAIVGSGPAGFYAAYRIMSRLPNARVDMYESLPVPYGLVRFGVAPDHPEVKNCREKFEEVALSPNFTFVGNTSVGTKDQRNDKCTVNLSDMTPHYDSILLAYGATKDRNLGVPGEDCLSGIYSAREFVGWYNGLPDCAGLAPGLTKGEEAVIIGQGNVALDVARMLLENVDNLRHTDITSEALEHLSQSRVRRVHIVGRRGPMQAAYTIKEVRELMKIPDVAFHPVDLSLVPPDLKALPRASRRLMEVVTRGSVASTHSSARSWSLDFCLSPKAFVPRECSVSEVGSTTFARTELPARFDPNAQARVTGEEISLPSSLVFRSIGYKSAPLFEFREMGIMFDDRRGVVANDGLGRVFRGAGQVEENNTDVAQQFPGLYCAGWVKRGPTGVIASTMQDAFDTADSVVQDWLSGSRFLHHPVASTPTGWDGLRSQISARAAKATNWRDWKKIDSAEKERGRQMGKEREKFTDTSEMLQATSL